MKNSMRKISTDAWSFLKHGCVMMKAWVCHDENDIIFAIGRTKKMNFVT